MNSEQQKKYEKFSKEFNKIIEKYRDKLNELKNSRKEMYEMYKMYDDSMIYDSEEFQKNISETRKLYMQEEEEFYQFLITITNYLNLINGKEKIPLNIRELRIEAQFHYCQCFIERSKIENQVNFHNTNKIDKVIKAQYSKLEILIKEQKQYDKKILEIMGIFLAVFSLIGVNLSFFSNLKEMSIWEIILLIVVINVILSDTIKVIFSIIRKEKIETLVEKIIHKLIK